MIPNCDKNVPGLLMAAARVNVPTIFCSGASWLLARIGFRPGTVSAQSGCSL